MCVDVVYSLLLLSNIPLDDFAKIYSTVGESLAYFHLIYFIVL